MSLARSRHSPQLGSDGPPWDSENAHVREVWRKLTDPQNVLALEQWLYLSAEGQPAEWARQALRVCRERSRGEGPAKP